MVWVVRQLLSLDLKEAKALLDILVGEVEKRSNVNLDNRVEMSEVRAPWFDHDEARNHRNR